MRKFTFVLALLAYMSVSAQVCRPVESSLLAKQVDKAMIERQSVINSEVRLSESAAATKTWKTREVWANRYAAPAAPAALEAEYLTPVGTYYSGIINNQAQSYSAAIVAGPTMCNWMFENVSSETAKTFKWTIDTGKGVETIDNVDAAGNANYAIDYMGSVYTPVLEVSDGSSKASYQLLSVKSRTGFLDIASNEPANLVAGDITQSSVYGGFSSGEYYGSGYVDEGKKCVSVIATCDKPLAPLFVKNMSAVVYTVEAGKPIIPAGVELNVQVLKVDGTTITDEVLATATATAEDVVLFDGTTSMGRIMFNFMEVDEFGFPSQVPLELGDCAFALAINGVDKANAKFTFCSANGWAGNGYMIFDDGSLGCIGYSNVPNVPQVNLMVQMEEAMFPTLHAIEGTNVVAIPAEGGVGVTQTEGGESYNDVDVVTNYPIEDAEGNPNIWVLNMPEWLEISYDDQYYDQAGIMIFYFEGKALPVGETGRKATVTLETYAGVQTKIYIEQGDAIGGIDNVGAMVKPVVTRVGDSFALTYAGANSVSVVNMAGQVVVSYELPAEGTFTMPAESLSNGVYILKFAGENAATVKVVK